MTTSTWSTLLNDLRAQQVVFSTVITWINQHYDFTPQAFHNGMVSNAIGQNEGACRVFALAQLLGLSEPDTLLCFAEHYTSVLAAPEGSDHANIRAFMVSGFAGLRFDAAALTAKA